jgi:VIT1/CCC1 family predicted Fe2+/Mn2+ transporter
MRTEDTLGSLRTFWKAEIVAGTLYGVLARRYRDPARKEAIAKLGEMELAHADVWRHIAKKVYGVSFEDSVFLKLDIALMKVLSATLPLTIFLHYMEHQERNAILEYSRLLEAFRDHGNVPKMITGVIRQEIGHEWQMMEQVADKGSYIVKAKEAIHGMAAGVIETLGLVIGLLAAHATTRIIGLTGLIATIGGMIAVISVSYISAKGHYDLYEGAIGELSIKREIHPAALRGEIENALAGQGIGGETAKTMMDAVGEDVGVLTNLLKAVKSLGEGVVPKEAVATTSAFFIMGTLPILVPFFVGSAWESDPVIPGIVAFVLAIVVISVAGLFIGVLSGKKISEKIAHNILLILGTCMATYAVGFAARAFLGIESGH